MRVAIASQLASMAVLMEQMDVGLHVDDGVYELHPIPKMPDGDLVRARKFVVLPREQTHPTSPKKSYRGRRGR